MLVCLKEGETTESGIQQIRYLILGMVEITAKRVRRKLLLPSCSCRAGH